MVPVMDTTLDYMLSPIAVADELGVDRRLVYRLIDSGRLRAYRVSERAWRVRRSDLDTFLAERSNG